MNALEVKKIILISNHINVVSFLIFEDIQNKYPGLKRFAKTLLGEEVYLSEEEVENNEDDDDEYDDDDSYVQEMDRMCFFLPSKFGDLLREPNRLKLIPHEKVKRCWKICSSENDNVGKQLAFCIDVNNFILEDWPYGCMMQDSGSKKLFALVLTDLYTLNSQYGRVNRADPNFVSVEKMIKIENGIPDSRIGQLRT